jgi:hypothetical protein
MTQPLGEPASDGGYDYDQQVRDLVSNDPDVRASAKIKLDEHYQRVLCGVASQAPDDPTIRYAVVRRTVSVVLMIPVDSYVEYSTPEGADRPMTDQEILNYETGLVGVDADQAMIESIEGAREGNIRRDCWVAFTDAPTSLADA